MIGKCWTLSIGPSKLIMPAPDAGTLTDSMVVASPQLTSIKQFLSIICLSFKLTCIDNPVHHNGMSAAYNVWIICYGQTQHNHITSGKLLVKGEEKKTSPLEGLLHNSISKFLHHQVVH